MVLIVPSIYTFSSVSPGFFLFTFSKLWVNTTEEKKIEIGAEKRRFKTEVNYYPNVEACYVLDIAAVDIPFLLPLFILLLSFISSSR